MKINMTAALFFSAVMSASGSQVAAQTSSYVPTTVTSMDASGTSAQSGKSDLSLKRKVAVARFTNATRYGRALLLPGEVDPVGAQATDILMARLVETQAFIVSERDSSVLDIAGQAGGTVVSKFAGVDALVIGSITELGRRAEGRSGFLNSTARQVAVAKVDIRLVDPRTNQAFFSTSGAGTATLESKEVAGFGSAASFDSALIDRAISAAIADVATNLIQNISARPWAADILDLRGSEAMISGGQTQGLRVGQELVVEEMGRLVTSAQSGNVIALPGRELARVQIVSFFGELGSGEGSVARVTSGSLAGANIANLRVIEGK